jgi:hypothetical protein
MGGIGAAGSVGEGGVVGVGHLVVNLGRFGLEGGGREGWAFADSREVGNIFLGGRYYLPHGFHVRLCFSHNHEVPKDILLASPVASLSGTADGIRHRSGAEVGAGWTYSNVGRLPFTWLDWLGAWTEVSLQVFPDASGPRAYVLIEYGLTVDLGRAS